MVSNLGSAEKQLPPREEATLPALISIDKKPDDDVLEDGGFSFDVDRHFLRLLPRYVQDRVSSIPHLWWDLSEAEIIDKAWPDKQAPDDYTSRLRIALWDEYDRSFRFKLAAIDFPRALRGIVSPGYFRSRILANSAKVVFLCTPPSAYENRVKDLHSKGLSELQKILDLPMINPDGTVDSKIADVKRRIYESLDMRLKGAIIQRIDSRTLNVNIDGDTSQLGNSDIKPDELKTMLEIEEELKALEAKSAAASIPGGGRAVEVLDASFKEEETAPGGDVAERVVRPDAG